MNTENLSTLKIHKLTQAQYDREFASGNLDENALYLTPDEDDSSNYLTQAEADVRFAEQQAQINELVGASTETEGLAYELDSNSSYYICTGIGTATVSNLVIPKKYNGKNVTHIAANAFNGQSTITSIVIPSTITNIGDYAFAFTGLSGNVVIPKSVTTMGCSIFDRAGVSIVYCEAESKPSDWSSDWDIADDEWGHRISSVLWGYKGDFAAVTTALNEKAPTSHFHVMGDIDGLGDRFDNLEIQLNNKSDSNHTHTNLSALSDYDTAKGTIEARLTALGFKQGTLQLAEGRTGTQGGEFYKKGVMVMMRRTVTFTDGSGITLNPYDNKQLLATVPSDFALPSGERIYAGIGRNTRDGDIQYPIRVSFQGTNIYVYQDIDNTNARWCNSFVLNFGYECAT